MHHRAHAFRTPWLSDGRLVAVLEDWSPRVGGLRLYYPGHRHVPASLRAFIEVMRETEKEWGHSS